MDNKFLPVNKKEMDEYGWDKPDFVFVTGDSYVDHPSFGVAIISRYLESFGFNVAILAQPDYKSCDAFREYGRPKLGFLVTSGNLDSMVAHYTVSKKKRSYDYYTPGGKIGARPDRAVIVYCNRIRECYGDIPIIIGGLEASLRRFAHYDYWDEKVRRSILIDSRADILSYGMGEKSILKIAQLLERGVPVKKIRGVRGIVYTAPISDKSNIKENFVETYDYDIIKNDKKAYAKAFCMQYNEMDSVRGNTVIEYYGDRMLVQTPPAIPLEREELDYVYSLPYMRTYHPSYEKSGGVPAIEEVRFSITHNRGCFGGCNFCALTFHGGREVRSRSIESVVSEAKIIADMPSFKGYIHDIGGPTANMRHPSCSRQAELGMCRERKCLVPKPCPHLNTDHSEYVKLLEEVQKIPKIKKVFIRSGIRYDYMMCDKSGVFFEKLVSEHTSGQLKVAPEHCCDEVLSLMGKPEISVYNRFKKRFDEFNKKYNLEQYLVPYLMSSHPGSKLSNAIDLACYLKESGCRPEQVQDFYPTPGTVSTVMYYTGINPLTGEKVYVETDYRAKQLQRILLQYYKRENHNQIRDALRSAGREDLIGNGPDCLVTSDNNLIREKTKKSKSNKKHPKYNNQSTGKFK